MVQQLLPAARERHGDAQAALANGSPTGAVYLAGYTVEMALKHSCLRTEGVALYEHVPPALAPARARLRLWLGEVPHDGYHSLEFWGLLLRETHRHRRGRVPKLVATAAGKAAKLHQCWMVALRYRSGLLQSNDARQFLQEGGWFLAHANELWR